MVNKSPSGAAMRRSIDLLQSPNILVYPCVSLCICLALTPLLLVLFFSSFAFLFLVSSIFSSSSAYLFFVVFFRYPLSDCCSPFLSSLFLLILPFLSCLLLIITSFFPLKGLYVLSEV